MNTSASETRLGSPGKTALSAGGVAAPVLDMLQQSVDSGGANGTVPRTTTVMDTFAHTKGRKTHFHRMQMTSQELTEPFVKFLVVMRNEGDFTNVSPFVIDKILCANVGIVTSVKKIKDGLLVEVNSAEQSKKLKKMTRFHEFEVSVKEHETLNKSKGVVTCRDLLNCSLTEIIENLADQGVIDAKRVMKRNDGKLEETASLIITFNRDTLPSKIKAGIHRSLPVRPYIPAPMRCFKCQKFGHISARCNNLEKCVCGSTPHPDTPCSEPMKCVNCEGNHSSRSRNCPIYKEEVAVQKVRVTENISFAEARKKVRVSNSTPIPGISYAKATAKTPTADTVKNLVESLVPEIIKACVSAVKEALKPDPIFIKPQPPQIRLSQSDTTEHIEPNSLTRCQKDSESIIDKRKRYNESDTLSDSGSSRTSSQAGDDTKIKKKKKGWPKGKTRKPPDHEQSSQV